MFTFAYARVSTGEQTTENQILEIKNAGYIPDSVYQETISGKVPAKDRPEFNNMMNAISRIVGDKRLIVSKIDRLGRDATDVMTTVKQLNKVGCAVKVLQLGDLDLTTTAGKLILTTLAAVAEMERDLIVERTTAGIARAKAAGKQLGRPVSTTPEIRKAILQARQDGLSVVKISKLYGVSRATVERIVYA